jgi:hypothetical protein
VGVPHHPGTTAQQLLTELYGSRDRPTGHVGDDGFHGVGADHFGQVRPWVSLANSLQIGQDRHALPIGQGLALLVVLSHSSSLIDHVCLSAGILQFRIRCRKGISAVQDVSRGGLVVGKP